MSEVLTRIARLQLLTLTPMYEGLNLHPTLQCE